MARAKRTDFRFLRYGCRSCRGRRWASYYHRRLPHPRNFERGSDKPAQTMTPNLHLWLIPLLPLAGAAINGFLGKRSSRQAVSTVALVFSGPAFAMALWVVSQFSSLTLPYIETL